MSEYIGKEVTYIAGSGKEYTGIVNSICDYPITYSDLPVVNLTFDNIRGRQVKKIRVLPEGDGRITKIWRPKQS